LSPTGHRHPKNKKRRKAMSRRLFLTSVGILFISLIAVIMITNQGLASGHVTVVRSFDRTQGQLPEGIAVDKVGSYLVSLGPPFFVGGGYGAIWKVSPDGVDETVLVEYPEGPAPAGVAVDPSGNVFYALPNPGDPIAGVYRISSNGSPERLPGSENIVLPNGLALDKFSNLYVSDSVIGAIWQMPADGSSNAEIWLSHELLAGCPDDFGANGVAFWKSNLFVANTSKGILVRVPIINDGSPGTPEIAAGSVDCQADVPGDLFGMDGIALDVHGNVYALLVLQNKLVKIDPATGTYSTLLDESDGLWNPASIYFGTGKGNREHVFIVNYAVLDEPPDSLGAAILSYDVGVPGLPVP
jgi:sugar lactone lactonase YvrE